MDKVEKIQKALIHHGKFNDRLYIMKFPQEGHISLIQQLTKMASDNNYSKIFAKIRKKSLPLFLKEGYKTEATIPLFYNGKEDCCFVSKFLTHDRAIFEPEPLKRFNEVLNNKTTCKKQNIGQSYKTRELTHEDANNMVNIFKQVFASYPFPIHDAEYIKTTMHDNMVYFGAFDNGKLISISSAEKDTDGQNAEMTDFAVLPTYRGKGLSKLLLGIMETEMKNKAIKTLYSIARLNSIPMNKTFLRAGYCYGGTLINNTNISGSIESMNILYKYI